MRGERRPPGGTLGDMIPIEGDKEIAQTHGHGFSPPLEIHQSGDRYAVNKKEEVFFFWLTWIRGDNAWETGEM
jgi:hypothetical protein